MTILEDLEHKLRKAKTVGLIFWIMLFIGIVWDTPVSPAALMLGTIGFFGTLLYIQLYMKCPKCEANFGQAILWNKKVKFCPGCGVDFNETKP